MGLIPRKSTVVTDGEIPGYLAAMWGWGYNGPLSADGDSLAMVPCEDVRSHWSWCGLTFRRKSISRPR